jgi:hypothetical protein
MVIMTQFHNEPTKAFVNQEELMVSLVPHVDELKGNDGLCLAME